MEKVSSQKQENSNDNNKKVIKFTIFVIIVIIILLIRSCSQIDKINNLVPTGNIDIFDITIDNNCCQDEGCNCICNKEDDSQSVFEEIDEDSVSIYDSDGNFNNSSKLNIFTNPAYEFKSIIAPLSTNTYQFVVRNNNVFNIKYSIKMDEVNDYNINMKYRLKLDGKYIKGSEQDWVTYDKLTLKDLKLSSKSKNVYQLEWKWFESNNDTYIGEVGKSYSLLISFDGRQI